MGRPCSVCSHAARKAIEAVVHAGTSYAEIAALHPGLTKAAVGRHMANHAARGAPTACEAIPDPLAFLSPPPPLRVREKPRFPPKPDALEPSGSAGNVVQFRASTPVLAEPKIEPREAPTPLTVAILQHQGYSIDQIAKRFGLVEQSMSALLSEVEDGYVRHATGSSSLAIIGRMLFKSEFAIAELEEDYQGAKRQGRNRDARDYRRLILEERRELRSMLREYGITRPVDPTELDSKPRQDMDDIFSMVKNSINGVLEETAPALIKKARLIG